VVVTLEESLGSDFSARFGPPSDGQEAVTPELDRWSREGLSFTNVIVTGNRTVRRLEGVLCSFLPLPGDAIVKRDHSENVASISRVLSGRDGRYPRVVRNEADSGAIQRQPPERQHVTVRRGQCQRATGRHRERSLRFSS
jgi:hypothetical protein